VVEPDDRTSTHVNTLHYNGDMEIYSLTIIETKKKVETKKGRTRELCDFARCSYSSKENLNVQPCAINLIKSGKKTSNMNMIEILQLTKLATGCHNESYHQGTSLSYNTYFKSINGCIN
jgi:hypothetical protein